MTDATDDLSEIETLARKATPGDLDTAEANAAGWHECPCCGGEGEVLGETFTNFDGVAMGVQFFGVGDEFEDYERYFRHMSPARTLRIVERLREADGAEDQTWPQWAAQIKATLEGYGWEFDNEDVDLPAAFHDWCEGFEQECDRKVNAAEARATALEARVGELDGALNAEREECAKLAESYTLGEEIIRAGMGAEINHVKLYGLVSRSIAQAIRSRALTKETPDAG